MDLNDLSPLCDAPGAVGYLAQALAAGDESAYYPLFDELLERGIAAMSSLEIGKQYCVQTVTYAYVGRLEKVDFSEIVLSHASCVYDTGRFSEFLAKGSINEAEPFVHPVHINRGSVVAVTHWPHKLPKSTLPSQ